MLDILWDSWPAILVVALAMVLIWCIACDCIVNQVDEGIVIGKEYTPARNSVRPVWTGKSTVVVPVHRAEKWEIQVRGVNENGEERTGWWAVSESAYNYISVGDYVFREGDAICVKGVEE